MNKKAIGVFDSGIGGLSVLKELVTAFPDESFLYLGDTARLPYGSKSPQTIRKYSEQVIDFLLSQNVKAVVIACNSASSQFFEHEWKGIPIYNVIEPGSRLAVTTSQNKKIGVLGTRATIQSEAYQQKIKEYESKAQIYAVACPLFVPLVEEGLYEDTITDLAVSKYLPEVCLKGIDTLVLGCTHYPFLQNAIQKFCGKDIQLISSGLAIVELLKKGFLSGRLEKSVVRPSNVGLYTTDSSSHFLDLSKKILQPLAVDYFKHVDL